MMRRRSLGRDCSSFAAARIASESVCASRGMIQVEARPGLAIHIRVHRLAIDRRSRHAQRAAHLRAAHLRAFFFRALQHRRQPVTLRGRKRRLLGHAVAVGKHRRFVLRRERPLDRGQALIHLLHRVLGHALVDHECDRERHRVRAEVVNVLPLAVFVDSEIAPGQPRHLVMGLVVQHRGRHNHLRGLHHQVELLRLFWRLWNVGSLLLRWPVRIGSVRLRRRRRSLHLVLVARRLARSHLPRQIAQVIGSLALPRAGRVRHTLLRAALLLLRYRTIRQRTAAILLCRACRQPRQGNCCYQTPRQLLSAQGSSNNIRAIPSPALHLRRTASGYGMTRCPRPKNSTVSLPERRTSEGLGQLKLLRHLTCSLALSSNRRRSCAAFSPSCFSLLYSPSRQRVSTPRPRPRPMPRPRACPATPMATTTHRNPSPPSARTSISSRSTSMCATRRTCSSRTSPATTARSSRISSRRRSRTLLRRSISRSPSASCSTPQARSRTFCRLNRTPARSF